MTSAVNFRNQNSEANNFLHKNKKKNYPFQSRREALTKSASNLVNLQKPSNVNVDFQLSRFKIYNSKQ